MPIPGYLVKRFDIPRPFKFFTAFLSDAERGGVATVAAWDGAGRVIDRGRRRVFDPLAAQEQICELAKRQLRRGEIEHKDMRALCDPPGLEF